MRPDSFLVVLAVATQVEAPAKFLFAALREPGDTRYPVNGGEPRTRAAPRPLFVARSGPLISDALRDFDSLLLQFSILGLGDVVVPGAFIALMREVDRDGLSREAVGVQRPQPPAWPRKPKPKPAAPTATRDRAWAANPYFYTGIAAYGAGLLSCFAANYLTKAGQPALVYIVPSLLLAVCGLASSRGELEALRAYESPRAAAATEAMAQAKAAREAAKEREAAAASKAKGRRGNPRMAVAELTECAAAAPAGEF